MGLFSLWTVTALILFTIWIGIARETRLTMIGYILQMLSILALYLYQICLTHEYAALIGLAAMFIIRLVAIPLLIRAFLKDGWWSERVMNDLISARSEILLYVLLAAFGFVLGNHVMGSAIVGGAVSMLLLGMGIVLVKHDPSKQIFGLLSADAAADLILIEIMSRLNYVLESLIYLAVFLAVLCMVILVKMIETRTNYKSVKRLMNLKG